MLSNSEPSSISEERAIQGEAIENIYDSYTDFKKKTSNRLELFNKKELYKEKETGNNKKKKKVTISEDVVHEFEESKSEIELIKKIAVQVRRQVSEERREMNLKSEHNDCIKEDPDEKRASAISKSMSEAEIPSISPKVLGKFHLLYPSGQGPLKLVWKKNAFIIAFLIKKFIRNLRDSIIYYSKLPLNPTHYAYIADKSYVNEDDLNLNDIGKKGGRNERIRELTKTKRNPSVIFEFLAGPGNHKILNFIKDYIKGYQYIPKLQRMKTLRKKSECTIYRR